METPLYWKSELKDIDEVVEKIKKGRITTMYSAGKRPIYLIEYGKKNEFKRTANYSSACGSGDMSCYADKNREGVLPCLFLVGAIHGSEIEGTVALLNLISVLENGVDLAGNKNEDLMRLGENANLLIIPCANPDGRARFPYSSAIDMTLDEFRYYAQGTWKNGELAGWPDCKKVHPIKDSSNYLGAYYNDDGVNLMHDNFSFQMAEETKLLLKTAEDYAPDLTVLFHGCANAISEVLMPKAVHSHFKDEAYSLAEKIYGLCKNEGLKLTLSPPLYGYDEPVHSYNLVSALTNISGELCVVYESNQGLKESKNKISYDEMYKQHIIFLSAADEYVKNKIRKKF